MNSLKHFPWPLLTTSMSRPEWDGSNFLIANRKERVLSYNSESSHWSDALTTMHEIEAGHNHPIDLASRRLAISSMRLLRDHCGPTIIDVGCSSGYILEELRAQFPGAGIIGADYLRGPLESLASRMKGLPILQFDLRKCPLPNDCVDGVTCLNVLEHIDDHEAALRHIYRILKPGGIAHIEVPANPKLYDIYDEYLLHYRRYRMNELTMLARRIGFRIERATHLGFSVFPAFWLIKMKNRGKLSAPAEVKGRLVANQIRATKVNKLFAMAIQIETRFGKYFSFPWGIRCVVVLKREG